MSSYHEYKGLLAESEMEIKEVVSVGKSNQSMGSKGICILVVNENLICKNIVAEMLKHCNYEVLHIGGVLDVLNAIWEAKDRLDLVLTNAHKLEPNGKEIIQHILNKLNLQVLLMSPEKATIDSTGDPFSCAAYVLHGLSRNGMNNLWKFALAKETGKPVAGYQEDDSRRPSIANIATERNTICSSDSEATRFNHQRENTEKSEDSKEGRPTGKKPRVVWTVDMHQKFLEAIAILGDKAFPKKIVEVMGIPGLTRENVASHLQKFRSSMRRAQEANELERIHYLPPPSMSRLGLLQTNTYTKESIRTSVPDYINKRNKFSFRTTSDTNSSTYLGGLRFSRADNSFKDFRIYGIQMRNMLLRARENSSYVGYRFTSGGNSIEFGKVEAEMNIVSTEKRASILDQGTSVISKETLGNATLLQDPSENGPPPASSVFPRNRDLSIPSLETWGDDSGVRDPTVFLEGITQKHCSSSSSLPQATRYLDCFLDQGGIDDDLIKGTGGTCAQFDWDEFDDTFFKHDD